MGRFCRQKFKVMFKNNNATNSVNQNFYIDLLY